MKIELTKADKKMIEADVYTQATEINTLDNICKEAGAEIECRPVKLIIRGDLREKFEKLREETGMPYVTQLEILIKGYTIEKTGKVYKKNEKIELPVELVKNFETLRTETGIPISTQIEIAYKGYLLQKIVHN